METWKSIKGFFDYEISTKGNVRSLRFGKIKYLKIQIDGNGYYFLFLRNKIGRKKFKIARLVAQTFIPNPDNLPTVDHIDRDKSNNSVENLRWATYKEQHDNRRFFVRAIGENVGNSVLTEVQVIEIKKLHKQGLGKRKIAKLLNILPTQAQSGIDHWKHLDS